jgi:hypothetical protein
MQVKGLVYGYNQRFLVFLCLFQLLVVHPILRLRHPVHLLSLLLPLDLVQVMRLASVIRRLSTLPTAARNAIFPMQGGRRRAPAGSGAAEAAACARACGAAGRLPAPCA